MRRRIARAFLWLCVIGALGAAGYWGVNEYQARAAATAPTRTAEPAGPVRVGMEPVAKLDVPVFIDGIGTVQGFNTVTVRSRIDGAIVEVAFREGQTVKAGEVLFRIDSRPYEAALDQAKAKLAQDQANLANLRLDLDRAQQLIGRGAASRQQLDTSQAQVNVGTALVEADRAAIEAAQTQFDYTTIRSPIGWPGRLAPGRHRESGQRRKRDGAGCRDAGEADLGRLHAA